MLILLNDFDKDNHFKITLKFKNIDITVKRDLINTLFSKTYDPNLM